MIELRCTECNRMLMKVERQTQGTIESKCSRCGEVMLFKSNEPELKPVTEDV